MLNPLDWLKSYAFTGAAIALIAALAWGGVQTGRLSASKRDVAELKAAWATDKANAAAVALKTQDEYRHEEQRRTDAKQEIIDDSAKKLNEARAAAARADTVAGKLRNDLAAYAAKARAAACNPVAADVSKAAADPLDVLSQLFRAADDRSGDLARLADERGIAGQQCQQLYESLTVRRLSHEPSPIVPREGP